MKKVLSILFVIIFAISCKDESVTQFGVYTPKSFAIEQTKLYTLNGEIGDHQKVVNFINRYDLRHSFIQKTDSM